MIEAADTVLAQESHPPRNDLNPETRWAKSGTGPQPRTTQAYFQLESHMTCTVKSHDKYIPRSTVFILLFSYMHDVPPAVEPERLQV